jgi:hypothetical protein
MPRISFPSLAFAASVLVVLTAAACGSGQTAYYSNYIDTLTLYALRNTPIRTPSAYSILDVLTVRTDTTGAFDFAFDIDSAGTPRIYPAGVLGLDQTTGIQLINSPFDNVHSAPTTGYVTDSALQVDTGSVFVARSRATSRDCIYYSLPRYAKFEVLSIDSVQRSITLKGLVDLNCGFRGLDNGVPGS